MSTSAPDSAQARAGLNSLAWVLGLALTACGGGGGDASPADSAAAMPVQALAGQVQKGPLLRGSTVTINTLTAAPVLLAAGSTTVIANSAALSLPALVPTGASFSMEVKDDQGSFTPQSAAIYQTPSGFVETTAEGYYFNELTGQRSADLIALRGLSNLRSDTALNVNILTDLSKERTLALARAAAGSGTVSSAIFNTARRQAQAETLRAFGIDARELGTVAAFAELDLKRIASDTTARPADTILLALSALVVQIGQNGSGVSDFINRFEADLADNGVVDGAALKAQIQQASAAVDFDRVAANMNRFYGSTRYLGDDIARWVDRSGGVYGVVQKYVQYTPGGTYSAGASYDSNAYTVAASDVPACYGAEVNDTAAGSAQLLNGSAVKANGYVFPVNSSTAATLRIRFTAQQPSAVGYLVRWDRVNGTCSLSNQPNKTRLLAYAAVSPDVGLFLNQLAQTFANCFALNASARVLGVDNTLPVARGGPNVTLVAEACQPLVSRRERTGVEFLQNGYAAGQYFYNLLTDAAMSKSARISDVEILRSTRAAAPPMAPTPALVLAVRYVDRYNRLGSFITVAQKIAGSAPAAGDWWITGNQQPLDVTVQPLLRRFTSVAGYTGATPSTKEHYRSAIGFFIHPFGPGGTLADGRPLSAVRISGPGVPGLVYVPPVQPGQTWMDLSNTSGDVAGAGARRCGATPGATTGTPTNCPYYWVARSTSVVPSSAAPVLRSPGATEGGCGGSTANQTCAWGALWSPTDVTAQLVRNAAYTVELFYGGQTTATTRYTKYLNASLADLTRAHTAGWVTLDAATVAAARPLAGQQSLDLAWTGTVANRVEVRSATATLANAFASVATPDDTVLRGSAGVTVAPGAELQWAVPSGYTGATSQRGILLNLRSWDGSARSQWFSYDTAN